MARACAWIVGVQGLGVTAQLLLHEAGGVPTETVWRIVPEAM